MTEELKNAEAEIKEDAAKAETSATGWIKTHIAWAIGLGCFLAGFVLGHIKL